MCLCCSLSAGARGLGLEERTAVGGETPLTLAVKAVLVHNVRTLLEHGASPLNTNGSNESPLLLGNPPPPHHTTPKTNCQDISSAVKHRNHQ